MCFVKGVELAVDLAVSADFTELYRFSVYPLE